MWVGGVRSVFLRTGETSAAAGRRQYTTTALVKGQHTGSGHTGSGICGKDLVHACQTSKSE